MFPLIEKRGEVNKLIKDKGKEEIKERKKRRSSGKLERKIRFFGKLNTHSIGKPYCPNHFFFFF